MTGVQTCALPISTLIDCLLLGNVAGGGGGGVAYGNLVRCRLENNRAGGSAYSQPCSDFVVWVVGLLTGGGGADWSTLHSCLLVGNRARAGGGAANSKLVNCTVVSNSASGFVYESYAVGGGGVFGGTNLNCVFAANVDEATPGTADADGPKGGCARIDMLIEIYNSCLATVPAPPTHVAASGNVAGPPVFVPGTWRLAAGSPGIDAGNNSWVTGATDLAGNPRIANGTVDMGAYEFQGAEPTGYAAWSAGIANGLTNYFDSAAGDGYPNLLKYATGAHPTEPDQVARMETSGEDGVPRLRFRRNVDATDVALIVEGADSVETSAIWRGIATNLGGIWSPPVVAEEGSGNPVTCTVADPEPLASNRFLRLRVILP